MKNYYELFSERGSSYGRAMNSYPDARQQEFLQALSYSKLVDGMRIADIPAGGQYLRKYISADIEYFPHEPCSTFQVDGVLNDSHQVYSKDLLPLPYGNSFLDITFSIAGIHHIEDKIKVFNEIYRVTKPQGQLIISDVANKSKEAYFLDHFVGNFNTTGHQGIYLDDKTIYELSSSGWSIKNAERSNFFWIFSDRDEMGDFCQQLFDIKNVSKENIIAAIEKILGVEDQFDGGVGMNWSLFTISARKI